MHLLSVVLAGISDKSTIGTCSSENGNERLPAEGDCTIGAV